MGRPDKAKVALFVVAAMFGSRHAAAQEEPLSVHVDPRAKGCPTEDEFRREVARQKGDEDGSRASHEHAARDAVHEHGPRVSVRIELASGVLQAVIDVDEVPSSGGRGTDRVVRRQTLRAPAHACRDLSTAAAIAVSLVFRTSDLRPSDAVPERAPDEVAPPPPSTPAPTEPTAAPGPPPRPPRREHAAVVARADPGAGASRSRGPRHSLFAGALIGRTAVPELGLGTVIGYGATWRERWGVAVEASSLFPRNAAAARGAAIRIRSMALSVGPCRHEGMFFGCIAVAFGATVGTGTHVQSPETGVFAYVEPNVRVGARVALARPFALRADVRGGAPLTRPRLLIEQDPVWRPPAVTLAATLAVETTF